MYTLRTITMNGDDRGVTNNEALGIRYKFIKAEVSPVAFKSYSNLGFARQEGIMGLVVDVNGSVTPLYFENAYFIVTETGSTFERLN